MDVTIAELEANLDEILEKAAAGEEILVLRNGEPYLILKAQPLPPAGQKLPRVGAFVGEPFWMADDFDRSRARVGRVQVTPSFLADTQIVLWSWHDPRRLTPKQADILVSDATVYVSIATVWEISIKVSLGKLTTREDVPNALGASGYTVLPISIAHTQRVGQLPFHHRDPFDRMLIAQAQLDGLTILTADRDFAAYDVALA